MRNPARNRRLTLAAFGVSAAILVWGVVDPPRKDTWLGAFMVIDLTAAFFLFCGAIVCQVNVVRQERLLSGDNVLARWRVDPERWKAFAELDKEIAAQPSSPANWLSLRSPLRRGGGEVVIGKYSLQVDGQFEILDTGTLTEIGWLPGPPPGLHLVVHVSDPNGSDVDKTFRIPIAAHADADAKRVIDYFNAPHDTTSRVRSVFEDARQW